MNRWLMDVTEGVRFALRALYRNKLRAVLTTLGIIIGVATVILMVMIVLGLNQSFEKQFAFLGSHTLYISRWDWTFGEADWRSMLKRRDMKLSYAEFIERESTLAEAVSPFGQTERTLEFGALKLTRMPVFGVDEDYIVTNGVEVDIGRFLTSGDCQYRRNVCVIGNTINEKLFEKVPAIGQRLEIGGRKFQVVGILAKQGKFFGQDMDNYVLLPIGSWMKAFGERGNDIDIVVKASRAEDVENLKWEVRGLMRNARGLGPFDPDDFGVNAQSMIMDWYKGVTAGVYSGGIMIALISLLVGGIGIMNIMLVSVTERTSEIGLRKALGAKRWIIAWQFLVEAAVICLLGGIVGVGFAAMAGAGLKQFLPTAMPLWLVIFGLIFSAVVGIFFGLYPATKAARLSPIEALRQE